MISERRLLTLTPGADQSSKAAFGKSAFTKTFFLLLKIRLPHINRTKSKNAFEHFLARFRKEAFCSLHIPKSARKYFCFLLDWCALVISVTKESTFEHVLARFRKKAFCSLHVPKSARKYFCFLLDWCALVISLTKERTFEHVLAKAPLPEAALLDWSAPGLMGLS